jgi:hypothetical protein
MDKKEVMLLVLLDLSAAFDCVDHLILSQRLRSCGIMGSAHEWIMSYLRDRHQSVFISPSLSTTKSVICGVPQGSVLGPLLFIIYLTGLQEVIAPFSINYMVYADDIQLFVTSNVAELDSMVQRMQNCVAAVKSWMDGSLLTLNESKTECILMGTPAMLKKCNVATINICNHLIPLSSTVRDLGVILDASLNFKEHISKVCSKSFTRLRLVSRLKKSISSSNYHLLINALVLSNLDFCSSILLGLPKCLLTRLQMVLNAAFRSIYRLQKYDHITNLYRQHKWLTIQQRVNIRVASIIYSPIKSGSPKYLRSLLIEKKDKRNLRSNDKLLLQCPQVGSAIGSRAFCVSGTSLWNELPLAVRTVNSTMQLKSVLMDHMLSNDE